jgi:hypothetical protein
MVGRLGIPCGCAVVAVLLAPAPALGAPLVLNEYNAVSSGNYLNFGTATVDGDGNSTNPPTDPYFGRVPGNGGDWFELVVVGDHVDIRGWTLHICDDGVCDEQLTFSNHAAWSDLRAGTILTVAEDVPTDLSFDPNSGDWWMNVRAVNGGDATYITPNSFPVSEKDWQLTIRDEQGSHVFGPIGEHAPVDPNAPCFPPNDDVNSGEIFRLEQPPSALSDPCFASLNDWEDGYHSTFGAPNVWNGGAAVQSFAHLRAGAAVPDRDGDGIPDDGDRSGWAGDTPCVGGATATCDDNCPGRQNAAQQDSGGPGGPDGMGDVCQCGDPSDDDHVTAADVAELRELFVGLRSELTEPDRCNVHGDEDCTLVDLAVIRRALAALGPGLAPLCPVAALPTDQTEYLFDPNRVLQVNIRIPLASWNVLRNQQNDIFSLIFSPTCGNAPWNDPYTYFSSDVTVDGQLLPNTGVRKKGFVGSLSTTEPSMKVKFDEYVGGQQFNALDRLTLNNNKQDPAHVKQCLGYWLMRKAGIPAPRCNFAHVTVTTVDGASEVTAVNDLYSNVESIEDPFLRRHFGSDQGKLYEGTLSDFWTGSFRNTIEPKNPAAEVDWSEVDALTSVLMNGALTPEARLAAIEALVDVDAFLTFWAAEGLIGHWDGYVDDQNNFWFYVNPGDGLIRFIPWGIDDTFGRGNPLSGRTGDPVHCDAIVPRSALARRLYEIPGAKAAYLARLQHLLDTVWDEAEIHGEIDRMEALATPVTGSLTTQLAPVRTWVDAHRALVQAEIASPPAGFPGQPNHFCVFNP